MSEFNRYFSDFKKIGQREKIIIFSILIASFIVGTVGAISYRRISVSKNSVNKTFTPTILPSTPATLTINSNTQSINVGESVVVSIKLNSPDQGVEAADFVINYDPEVLTVLDVAPGSYFGNYPIKNIGENFVKLSGVASFSDNKIIVPKGEGTVGSITFESLTATESTAIGFDRDKTIIASGGKNILDLDKIFDVVLSVL